MKIKQLALVRVKLDGHPKYQYLHYPQQGTVTSLSIVSKHIISLKAKLENILYCTTGFPAEYSQINPHQPQSF